MERRNNISQCTIICEKARSASYTLSIFVIPASLKGQYKNSNLVSPHKTPINTIGLNVEKVEAFYEIYWYGKYELNFTMVLQLANTILCFLQLRLEILRNYIITQKSNEIRSSSAFPYIIYIVRSLSISKIKILTI